MPECVRSSEKSLFVFISLSQKFLRHIMKEKKICSYALSCEFTVLSYVKYFRVFSQTRFAIILQIKKTSINYNIILKTTYALLIYLIIYKKNVKIQYNYLIQLIYCNIISFTNYS